MFETWGSVVFADGRDGVLGPRRLGVGDEGARTIFCPACGVSGEVTDENGVMCGPLFTSAAAAGRALRAHEASHRGGE